MLAHVLKDAVSKYWVKKRMAVTFELGLCKGGRLRADVLAVAMSGKVVLVEIKSSVADFKSDKKWPQYAAYADQMYFAMDEPTYLKVKHLIPKGTGIMVIKEVPSRSGARTLLKASIAQKAKWEPMDEDTRRELFIRMVFRTADANRYKRNT